jgi:hypothetical protein
MRKIALWKYVKIKTTNVNTFHNKTYVCDLSFQLIKQLEFEGII